jgi:hypothetical protein
MPFKEIFYAALIRGIPVRRKGWEMYWILKDGNIECHNPLHDEVTKITETKDILYKVLEQTLMDDWEIAT